MNRTNLARRYLPLAAAVAVQILIIAVIAPSTAPSSSSSLAAGAGGSTSGYSTGGYSTGGGSSAGSTGGSVGSAGGGSLGNTAAGAVGGTGAGGPAGVGGQGVGSTGAGGGAVGGGSGGGGSAVAGPSGAIGSSGGATGGSTGGAAPTKGGAVSSKTGGGAAAPAPGHGDTTHCVGGREFGPSIDYLAPPCTPGTIGGTYPNGGSTYKGVTGNQITIVDYVSNYGAEVNAILQAEGLLVTYAEAQPYDQAVQNFVNSHYVLWGRKVKIITYQGQCQSVPPNYQCLIPEFDQVVSTYHPYAVFWDTTLCSACFAELARDGVVGFGGAGFSDAFSNANAPFFYSADQSSSRVETAFAQWWCASLSSKNDPSRKVAYGGKQNPAQNFNGKPRVLGVISTNDPDNENTVTGVLQPALNQYCGDGNSINVHHYFYSQDINTAAQQVEAGISAMDTSSDPATSVLCLCDPVAPAFLYEGEQQHNYYPENLIASDQGMDLDQVGQSYGATNGNQSSLGCPSPQLGCEYDNAFGLSSVTSQQPQNQDAGTRVYDLGGGHGAPPFASLTATYSYWNQYNMMFSLIENTGPDLNPAHMQAAAPSMGMRGGGTTGYPEVGFAKNDYHWIQDARIVYWNKSAPSSYNAKPGTYVEVGPRVNLGGYPSQPGGPQGIPYRS